MINNFFKGLRFILLFVPMICFSIEYQYEEEPVDDGLIKELRDFEAAIALSKATHRPLMVEFSTAWCEYCEALEQQVLKPMLKNKHYDEAVIIRKLEVDDANIRSSVGRQQTAIDFAMEHNVNLYPTLLFFNGEGKEISQRIVGIVTLDYIGEKIDLAIKKAKSQF